MYTSTFYETAVGEPNPPFPVESPLNMNKLPIENCPSSLLLKVFLKLLLHLIDCRKITWKSVELTTGWARRSNWKWRILFQWLLRWSIAWRVCFMWLTVSCRIHQQLDRLVLWKGIPLRRDYDKVGFSSISSLLASVEKCMCLCESTSRRWTIWRWMYSLAIWKYDV